MGFRQAKAAIIFHTRLDLRGNIPTFIHISNGKLHDVSVLNELIPEPGRFYINVACQKKKAVSLKKNGLCTFWLLEQDSNLRQGG